MSIRRYYTVGAVAPDLRSLDSLAGRLEGVEARLLVLCGRRDEGVIGAVLPEAETRAVETGLTRLQRLELGSTYLGVTAVSVLMGAVHLATGLAVQAVVTLAVITGLVLYRRRPKVRRKVVGLGLPEELATKWETSFSRGFALVLAVVPEDSFDEAQDAFLEDPELLEPLAVDRRPVL